MENKVEGGMMDEVERFKSHLCSFSGGEKSIVNAHQIAAHVVVVLDIFGNDFSDEKVSIQHVDLAVCPQIS